MKVANYQNRQKLSILPEKLLMWVYIKCMNICDCVCMCVNDVLYILY